MKRASGWLLAGLIMVALAGLGIVGCETTQTTDSVITVSPPSQTVSNGATVVFTASQSGTTSNSTMALPLVWSVSDPARGTIRASSGVTAIYEAKNVRGNNTITVHDQGDNSGIAVVILE